MFIAGVVVLFLVIVALKCIVVVPADSAFIVDRLGRYHRTLTPGRHFVAPFVDRVGSRFTTLTARGQLSESAITHDNVPVRVESTFRWKIVDPARAAAGAADVDAFVDGVVRTKQRDWISSRAWKDVRETTGDLEREAAHGANEAAGSIGVEVLEVTVQRLDRA